MVEWDNEREEIAKETAQTPQGEEKKGADGSFGKFKNPQALYSAYIGLEAEYTKKCQKLKELEKLREGGEAREEEKTGGGDPLTKEKSREAIDSESRKEEGRFASDRAEDKGVEEEVIKRYLAAIAENAIPLMRSGGSIVTSEKKRAKTLQEARGLALQFFQGKDNESV